MFDLLVVEYAPLSSSTRFLQGSWTTPLPHDEFFYIEQQKRARPAQHQFQLMAYSAGTSGSTTNMCTHERYCFPQGLEDWEMFSHYCIHVRTSEHMRVELFPRYFTTPTCANAQSPEGKQNQGVEGVKCLTGGSPGVSLSLSLYLIYVPQSRAISHDAQTMLGALLNCNVRMKCNAKFFFSVKRQIKQNHPVGKKKKNRPKLF